MDIIGMDMPIAVIVSVIAILSTLLVSNFFVTELEYLTQDIKTHKSRKILYSSVFFVTYICFLLMWDFLVNGVPRIVRVAGDKYCYLDYLDINHKFAPEYGVIIFLVIYSLALFYIFSRTRKVKRIDERVKRIKLENEWKKLNSIYMRGVILITKIDYSMDESKGLFKNLWNVLMPSYVFLWVRETVTNFVLTFPISLDKGILT